MTAPLADLVFIGLSHFKNGRKLLYICSISGGLRGTKHASGLSCVNRNSNLGSALKVLPRNAPVLASGRNKRQSDSWCKRCVFYLAKLYL